MNSKMKRSILIRLLPFCLLVGMLAINAPCIAQEKPPRPILITVSTAQHLSFGTFIQAGTYGTVTVSYDGARSASGSIILPNMSSIVTPALYGISGSLRTVFI